MEVSILRKSKGQVFLPDFISSVVVFSFILFFFMISWNSMVNNTFSGNREDIVASTQRSQTLLLETEGYPGDWNRSTVKIPGLREGRYISPEKFVELKNTPVSVRNRALKNADYNLTLLEDGAVASFNGTKLTLGSEINNTNDVIVLREQVAVNKSGEIVRMQAVYAEWR